MGIYDWDPALETGNDAIDQQHRGIFELARTLAETCEDCSVSDDAVEDAVYSLADYVIQHFSDEEELMSAASYPEFHVHQSLHQTLTAEVLRITSKYFEGQDVTAATLAPFLADWLRTHIRDADKQFAEFTR